MVAYKNILIEQVNKLNFEIAIAAGKKVFPNRWLIGSKKAKRGQLLIYYLIYNHANQVVAITGFYEEPDDPRGTYWLCWYGVLPEFRGKGYGKETLEYTELLVKSFRGNTLKLWTTEEPDEAAAQILFEKMNYSIVGRKTEIIGTTSYDILIRSKTL